LTLSAGNLSIIGELTLFHYTSDTV
jgi:hypothetical protein